MKISQNFAAFSEYMNFKFDVRIQNANTMIKYKKLKSF